MMNNNQPCYLDANFLIAFFLPNHEDEKASRKKMFELFARQKKLLVSCLAIDETMHKICTITNDAITKSNKKNKEKHKMKSHADFYLLYTKMLNYIMGNPLMKITQFKNDIEQGTRNAVENIKKYKLTPHDAFHYAMMQDMNIDCIVTKDKDFDEIKEITVLSY